MKSLNFAVVAAICVMMVGFVYADGGGGIYKINENGSVTFIKSAEKVDGPQWSKLCKHKNCSMIKVTANDSLPIVVNKGDYGYGAGEIVSNGIGPSNKINPSIAWVRYYAYCENNVWGIRCWAWSNRNGAGCEAAFRYCAAWWF